MNLTNRDLEIFRRHKAGETQRKLAGEFDISPNRIHQICVQLKFIEAEPALAAKLDSGRELSAAAFLWDRGYKISPVDN